jgi:hypothetical protein
MDFWTFMEYAAWTISALLVGSMLIDARRIGRTYSDDVLLSSREGEE